jgi:hypothetical protein
LAAIEVEGFEESSLVALINCCEGLQDTISCSCIDERAQRITTLDRSPSTCLPLPIAVVDTVKCACESIARKAAMQAVANMT